MTHQPPIKRRVAICVCTHSRPQGLERMLLAVRRIQLGGYDPRTVEIIVVDNNPDPAVREICDRVVPGLPIKLHYEIEPQQGITYARNRAVRTALERGADFVAFIDDDDEPRPDWLIRLLDRQADSGADIVFGAWMLHTGHIPKWARKSRLHKPSVRGKLGLPTFSGTGNVLIGRDILERMSNTGEVFSHRFLLGGEDKDFFLRARALNARLASADGSIIYRIHGPERYTVGGLIRYGIRNGCVGVVLARIHGGTSKLVGKALRHFFLSFIALPLSLFSRGRFAHQLYRLAKSVGVLYSTVGGRVINY